MRLRLLSLLAVFSTSVAAAHEGHGTPGDGHTVKHFATEPIHVGVVVVALVAAVAFCTLMKIAQDRRRTVVRNKVDGS